MGDVHRVGLLPLLFRDRPFPEFGLRLRDP